MLPFSPHTVTVYPVTDNEVGEFVEGRDLGTGVTVKGSLQPKSADHALRVFGIEIERPHVFYCLLADADKFAQGYLVVKGTRRFVVRGVQQTDNNIMSHARIGLEEVTHAIDS